MCEWLTSTVYLHHMQKSFILCVAFTVQVLAVTSDAGSIPNDKSFTLANGSDVKLPMQVKVQLLQGGGVLSEKLIVQTRGF
jgi:hypothetical protein